MIFSISYQATDQSAVEPRLLSTGILICSHFKGGQVMTTFVGIHFVRLISLSSESSVLILCEKRTPKSIVRLIAAISTERRNGFEHRRYDRTAASQIKASNWTLLSNCLSRYDTVSRHTHNRREHGNRLILVDALKLPRIAARSHRMTDKKKRNSRTIASMPEWADMNFVEKHDVPVVPCMDRHWQSVGEY